MIARALARTLLAALLLLLFSAALTTDSRAQQSTGAEPVTTTARATDATTTLPADAAKPPPIDLVTVDGPIDPVTVGYLLDRVDGAQTDGSQALVIQLDTPGGLATDAEVLVSRIAKSRVPVILWIGPAFARAESAGFALFVAAGLRAVSPGAVVGASEPGDLRGEIRPSNGAALASLAVMRDPGGPTATARGRFAYESALGLTIKGDAAVAQGIADYVAPTIGDAVVGLDGARAFISPDAELRGDTWFAGPVEMKVLSTARVVEGEGGSVRREPAVDVRFFRMPFTYRVLHSVASPSVAYFLLLTALLLIAFEFYTSGVGLVGLVGGVVLALAGFGLAIVGPAWLSIALILVAYLLFASDIQEGVRGPASALGFGVLVLALGLLRVLPPPALRLPIWLLLVLLVLVTAAWRLGVAVLVRTRYWSPSIERADFIGREIEVREPLNSRGTVRMGEGLFAARASSGQMLRGEKGRVARLDGSDLVIVPIEEGNGDDDIDDDGRRDEGGAG